MKSIIKKSIWVCLILFTAQSVAAGNSPSPTFKWQVGEELVYSVKWSFLSIGKLRLQVLSEDSLHNRKVYHCRIYIDSNPSLPFVSIHDIYDSYIDARELYSHIFLSYEQHDDYVLFTRYKFDYDKGVVHLFEEKQKGKGSEVVLDSSASIPSKVHDSLSLLFYARAMVKNKIKAEVPVYAFYKLDTTEIQFTGKTKMVEANDHNIEGYYLDGRLRFVGIAGVKEGFKGWFSRDKQSVPLKAYMKAFIGSVRIELYRWNNWDGDDIFKDLKKDMENKK